MNRKLKGSEMAIAYGTAGFFAGAFATDWQPHHPNYYLVMAGAVGLAILIAIIAIFRV